MLIEAINSVILSVIAGIVLYEYHIIRKTEEKVSKMEERTRWIEYIVKQKELKK
jgi:cytosine/uracil/thiamine/allantoin permease